MVFLDFMVIISQNLSYFIILFHKLLVFSFHVFSIYLYTYIKFIILLSINIKNKMSKFYGFKRNIFLK